MSSLLLKAVHERLQSQCPLLYASLTLVQIQQFLSLCQRLLPDISSTLTATSPILPPHVAAFLAAALKIDDLGMMSLWDALYPCILQLKDEPAPLAEDDLFRLHGFDYKLGQYLIAAFEFTLLTLMCRC